MNIPASDRKSRAAALPSGLRKTFRQFVKSLFTAWAAFLVDWGILELLVLLVALPAGVLKIFSYPFALLTTYLLSRYWVFSNPGTFSGGVELILYFAGAIVSLSISAVTVYLLSDLSAFMSFRISNIIGMILVFVWNFIYRKFVVFRDKAAGDMAVSKNDAI